MNLEEAIEKLKETQDSYLKDELDIAIETALQALGNSIPKEKVEKKIQELKLGQEKTNKNSWVNIYQYQILILQELLEVANDK